jgi:hypothetical protein
MRFDPVYEWLLWSRQYQSDLLIRVNSKALDSHVKKIYIMLDCKLDQRLKVFHTDRDILQFFRGSSPAVAWGDIYHLNRGRGSELPSQGMLPTAATNNEDPKSRHS